MNDVIDDEHKKLAMKFKRLNSLLKENEILIRIGAYEKGNDKELDLAISKKDEMNEFLRQNPDEIIDFEETKKRLKKIFP